MEDAHRPKLATVIHWVPAALSVAMITAESTATMSADNTSHWLYPLWIRLFGPLSAPRWDEVHHLIRKAGHFTGYGLVSLAFLFGWYRTLRRGDVQRWVLLRRASVWAVVCTLLVATLDEFHQSFLPSRTSSPIDVCIDLSGAIAAQLLALAVVRIAFRRS